MISVSKTGIQAKLSAVALTLSLSFAVIPSPSHAADLCVVSGTVIFSPALRTRAASHSYSLSGTATCASGTHAVTGSGGGFFGCAEPIGTSTANVTIGGVGGGQISLRHVALSLTGTGSGTIAAAQIVLSAANPADLAQCAMMGLTAFSLTGTVAAN